jgi:uncharacterized protein YndB with AHSA1/START domain
MNTDCIEKKILLRAPRERVWRALSDSTEFGTWFGLKFDGPFVAGQNVHGVLVPTTVDPEIGKLQEPHSGTTFEIRIETMEPERLFAFRWHPHAVDAAKDYSAEPMTLVAFHLEEVAEGVLLTLAECGFDQIPLERRAQAFAANEGGWTIMVRVVEKYVSGTR